jgi:ABC-type uncharacterized transport system auxiliary subunit
MRTVLSMLIFAACLCGCGSEPVWKRQTFAFSAPSDPPSKGTQTNVVALNRVSVSPLFQSESFTYRVGENAYEQDPYASFLVSPERAVAEGVRTWMRRGGVFGILAEPGSDLNPNVVVEAAVNELCGDFRQSSRPAGVMEIHFVVYDAHDGVPGRVLLDKTYTHESTLPQKTPAALMAAWETDLREIMESLKLDYADANSNGSGR